MPIGFAKRQLYCQSFDATLIVPNRWFESKGIFNVTRKTLPRTISIFFHSTFIDIVTIQPMTELVNYLYIYTSDLLMTFICLEQAMWVLVYTPINDWEFEQFTWRLGGVACRTWGKRPCFMICGNPSKLNAGLEWCHPAERPRNQTLRGLAPQRPMSVAPNLD